MICDLQWLVDCVYSKYHQYRHAHMYVLYIQTHMLIWYTVHLQYMQWIEQFWCALAQRSGIRRRLRFYFFRLIHLTPMTAETFLRHSCVRSYGCRVWSSMSRCRVWSLSFCNSNKCVPRQGLGEGKPVPVWRKWLMLAVWDHRSQDLPRKGPTHKQRWDILTRREKRASDREHTLA